MTDIDLELDDGETLVADTDELIYRQITKHYVDPHGVIATHAYTGESGSGDPSYARSSLVSAQDSRDWHTRNTNSPSLSVRAVTVGEVVAAKRWVIDDSDAPLLPDEKRAPGHCFIDVDGLDRLTLKSLRAVLWKAANDRGEIPTHETLADGELDVDFGTVLPEDK
jgi:hypothetical protein